MIGSWAATPRVYTIPGPASGFSFMRYLLLLNAMIELVPVPIRTLIASVLYEYQVWRFNRALTSIHITITDNVTPSLKRLIEIIETVQFPEWPKEELDPMWDIWRDDDREA